MRKVIITLAVLLSFAFNSVSHGAYTQWLPQYAPQYALPATDAYDNMGVTGSQSFEESFYNTTEKESTRMRQVSSGIISTCTAQQDASRWNSTPCLPAATQLGTKNCNIRSFNNQKSIKTAQQAMQNGSYSAPGQQPGKRNRKIRRPAVV